MCWQLQYLSAQTDVMDTLTESTTCFNITSQQFSQNILVYTIFVDPECSCDFISLSEPKQITLPLPVNLCAKIAMCFL
jgi:hypothetical protein